MATVALIAAFSFVLNMPFGYLRSRSRRYTLKWFTYIHVPVFFVIAVRVISQTDYRFIPLFIFAAIAGQYFGGKIAFN